jgi:membrane complex biogenesis BtpA family protein
MFAESLLTDQGIIDACAHDLTRFRKQLGASDVAIFADVRSKHAAPLTSRPVEESARDTAYRGMADALIVTGLHTGAEPDKDQLHRIRGNVPDLRILIGSGVTTRNAAKLLREADGAIVGTHLKEIVKWLSRKLGKPSSRIRIAAGLTSSLKIIAIIGMNENGFLEAIR